MDLGPLNDKDVFVLYSYFFIFLTFLPKEKFFLRFVALYIFSFFLLCISSVIPKTPKELLRAALYPKLRVKDL